MKSSTKVNKSQICVFRQMLLAPLPALDSPGENILEPEGPDPPNESTQTVPGTGVREGLIAFFPVHVAAPVMLRSPRSLSRFERLTLAGFYTAE